MADRDPGPIAPQTQAAGDALRAFANTFPQVYEDFPWGELAMKVKGPGTGKGKVFVFMFLSSEGLSVSVKLPQSFQDALATPYTAPTGYGLGKSGWVSARYPPEAQIPMEQLQAWIEESWRAVAPKRLVASFSR